MELTKEHYERAAIAYNAYCKQTGGKSLVSGEQLPAFDALNQRIKDAWAAVAIALSLQIGLEADRAIRSLTERAKFGDQCYQDRCENAYVEQTVMKKAVAEASEREAITVDGQAWTAERIASLCEAIWPGKPRWEPTKEKPQQDFYEAVVESLRFPTVGDPTPESETSTDSTPHQNPK